MSGQEVFTVSGAGVQAFAGPAVSADQLRIIITSLGMGEPMELVAEPRYLHFGWFALCEIWSGGVLPDGNYGNLYHFVDFVHTFYNIVYENQHGSDGFIYAFKPGVTAELHFEYP